MWQAMRYMVIIFRAILQAIVPLRMCEQRWQSVVELLLAGKLFHQGFEVQHTAATYPDRCLQWPSFQQNIGTDDSVTLDPTLNLLFRGIPFVFNWAIRIFPSLDATIVSVYFPLTWKVSSSDEQTWVRNVSSSSTFYIVFGKRCVTLLKLTTTMD